MSGTAVAVANYIAISTNATAPAVADTTLTGELATAGGGLIRGTAAFTITSNTGTAAAYTLTRTFTANATDGASNTINKMAVFNASSGGTMVFESLVPNPPTLIPSDSVAITETVNI